MKDISSTQLSLYDKIPSSLHGKLSMYFAQTNWEITHYAGWTFFYMPVQKHEAHFTNH